MKHQHFLPLLSLLLIAFSPLASPRVTWFQSSMHTEDTLNGKLSTPGPSHHSSLATKLRGEECSFKKMPQCHSLRTVASHSEDLHDSSFWRSNGHGTGLKTLSASTIRKKGLITSLDVDSKKVQVSYSQAVDWSTSPYFPPIGDQDLELSCTAWAAVYYMKTFQEAKEHGWDLSEASWEGGMYGEPSPAYQDKIFSPDFVYHQINGGGNNPTYFIDAMRIIHHIGAATWETMPNNPNDSTTFPSEVAWREAPLHRSKTSGRYVSLTTKEGIQTLKTLLANGQLALIGVNAGQYSNLKQLNTTKGDIWTYDSLEKRDENHANTVVGYNESIRYNESGEIQEGAFRVANSFGTQGDWTGEEGNEDSNKDGKFWISYKAMQEKLAWENALYYNASIGYTPRIVSVLEMEHESRNEVQVTIGNGSISDPLETKFMYPPLIQGPGACPYPNNKMILDITEFGGDKIREDLFVKVFDGGRATTGEIDYLGIEKYTDTYSPTTEPEENITGTWPFLPSETVNDKVKIIRVFKDQDKDGLSRSKERKYGTDPTKKDTDGDGLLDGREVHDTNTDPTKKDTDGDGLTDYEEVETYGTNPRKSDSDGDGASDEKEVAIGTDPLDEDSTPILGMLPIVFYAIVIGIVAVIAIISITLYYFLYSKREQSGS